MAYRNIFATSFLILLALASTSVADGLPLTESFETGDAEPDGWRKGANVPGVQYIYDKETASDGKRSLSLQ